MSGRSCRVGALGPHLRLAGAGALTMVCRSAINQMDSQHQLSFLAAPEGYAAICLRCGMAFKSASEWLNTPCGPARQEDP